CCLLDRSAAEQFGPDAGQRRARLEAWVTKFSTSEWNIPGDAKPSIFCIAANVSDRHIDGMTGMGGDKVKLSRYRAAHGGAYGARHLGYVARRRRGRRNEDEGRGFSAG